MTNGSYMGIVGSYLMLFAMAKGMPVMNWIGLVLVTIGFCVTAHYEDQIRYRLERLEKEKKKMIKKKKVMISQPMRGLDDYKIRETRRKATEKLEKEGYEVADSYFTEEWLELNATGIKNKPLWFLAKSLAVMSDCDTVYFCKGWEKARGCFIEHEVAVAYGLEIYEE